MFENTPPISDWFDVSMLHWIVENVRGEHEAYNADTTNCFQSLLDAKPADASQLVIARGHYDQIKDSSDASANKASARCGSSSGNIAIRHTDTRERNKRDHSALTMLITKAVF